MRWLRPPDIGISPGSTMTPVRHTVWRHGVARHLGGQIDAGFLGTNDAIMLAKQLGIGLANSAYKLADG